MTIIETVVTAADIVWFKETDKCQRKKKVQEKKTYKKTENKRIKRKKKKKSKKENTYI